MSGNRDVQEGWPDKSRIKGLASKYVPYQSELNLVDNLLLMGTRIVIPSSLRPEMLNIIHEGHQGVTKCRDLARESIWWPGLSSDILELVKACQQCSKRSAMVKEPLIPSHFPDRAWEKVATDLFQIGKVHYLILVDFYSRYPEIAKLENEKSATVINHMKSIFARHGIPKIVCSDNGPQYSSVEFQEFARNYQFFHVTSSPGHASGNGEAERAVRTVKGLVNQKDSYIALLNYRNSPLQNGYSPAQLLMGRRLNTKIPIVPSLLNPKPPNPNEVQKSEENYKNQMKKNFDRRHRTHDLSKLNSDDLVWITDKEQSGIVSQQANHDRSYIVETESGSQLRRNRVQLKELKQSDKNESEHGEPAKKGEIRKSLTPEIISDIPRNNISDNTITTRSGRSVKQPKKYSDFVCSK